MVLEEFQDRELADLYELGNSLGLRTGGLRTRHHLIYEILSFYGRHGTKIDAAGVLEGNTSGFGFLRSPRYSLAEHPDDPFIHPHIVRKFGLRVGNLVRGLARGPQHKEKFLPIDEITHVEGIPFEDWEPPTHFDKLTALHPEERIILDNPDVKSVSARVVDIIAPLGKGQRGLIVAPPRAGKTILLKEIAKSIRANHPDIELLILLIDERPEEVTDFEEAVDTPVYASTFDEPGRRHIQVAELVLERAKRLVEHKKHVVILLDSITRLARSYNRLLAGGRLGSGGIDHKALAQARKVFSFARNVEEGGSLTIIATALVETGSRMDDVIFEEFKGTGNMEIQLDRELAEKRIYPAIHILQSGTRRDDLLYHPDEFRRITPLRRQLAQMPAGDAMETLVRHLHQMGSVPELLLKGII
ncbi:MAG: transcription termination factor Rho [Verrucomicrobiales bacterium]